MMKNKLQLASTASLGILALVAFGSPARADNIAFSSLAINNFAVNTTGGSLTLGSITNSSGDSATLNGVGSAPGSASSSATADVAGQCVGNCAGITPNQMTMTNSPPPVTQVFSRGDAYVIPTLSGTNAGTVAESQLLGTAKAISLDTAGTNSSFTFTGVTNVTMSFSAVLNMLAQNLVPGGNILVKASWTATLDEIIGGVTTVLATFVPTGVAANDLNITSAGNSAGLTGSVSADACSLQNNSLGASLPGQTNAYNCSGNFSATIDNLNSGITYALVIGQQVSLNATSIPEPKTLGLLAVGLLGVGFFMRRQQRRA